MNSLLVVPAIFSFSLSLLDEKGNKIYGVDGRVGGELLEWLRPEKMEIFFWSGALFFMPSLWHYNIFVFC